MYYVYILKSLKKQGFTEDLKKRMLEHNAWKSLHTNKYLPCKIIYYCCFIDKDIVLEFEKYLKSVSWIAFRNKILIRS